MTHPRTTPILGLVVLLVAACAACSGSDEAAATSHEWEADLDGSVEWEMTDACTDYNVEGVTTITTADGTMGELGPVTVRFVHCPSEEDGYFAGTVTFTDENGDELSGAYDEVTDDFGMDPQSWPIEITGGTGRFADASGTVYLMPYLLDWGSDPVGWSAHLEGTVAY